MASISEQRTNIYPYNEKSLKNTENRLIEWRGSPRNKELISDFQEELSAKGTGKVRIAKLRAELIKICDTLNKDLDSVEYKDIRGLVAQINNNPSYAEATKSDYRRAIKGFYLWFQDEDKRLNSQNPEEREAAIRLYKFINKEVKSTYKKKSPDYSQIITEEELDTLISKGCKSALERAIVSFLHESGCRVGELLGIRIRDIELKKSYAIIKVDGKTGERRVPITKSLPHILRWKEEHPDKNNSNSLLWISKNPRFKDHPLRYIGIVRLLDRVADRAGLTKRHNPHWFRHSRATINAPQYSEAILCKLMGWSIGSKQVQTYVHLGAGQVEKAFLQNEGLEEKKKEAPKIQVCGCGEVNPSQSKYCFKCGKPLSVSVVLADEDKKNAAIDEALMLFAKIMSDPELKAKFEAFRQEHRP